MKLHSYKVDLDKMILKSPFKQNARKTMHVQQMQEKITASESACTRDTRWWEDEIVFANVLCKEHDEYELVPERNYQIDLKRWYTLGLHPRFSIDHAMIAVGQRWGEIWRLTDSLDRSDDARTKERKNRLNTALRESRTEEEFLKKLHPDLFINLYSDGRRYRVTNTFKTKFKAKNFTVEDFFHDESQELRRLILRRGVSVKDVLGKMKLLAEDNEGKIYELKNRLENWRSQHYLYVVCPSTGQEYLLGIPQRFTSPKVARRWTFNLPEDAQFAKEA